MTVQRVVLAEDHVLMRAGLRLLLERIEAVAVVGEASDGAEALQLINELQPDIAVLDIAMAQLSGLEVAEQVHAALPLVKIIILSMHADAQYVRQALAAGARAYLLKDAAPAELVLAVAAVSRGDTYLCPAVANQVVVGYLQRHVNVSTNEPGSPLDRLTPRQREILHLIAEGCTTQDIAQRLCISIKTAEGHRAQLMERLDIHDVAGLVRFAIRQGLVSSDH